MKTSIETQIEDWLRMSDHGGRGRVRVGVRASAPAIVTRASLTPGARLDLAGLIAAGVASSAFFLAALLPAPAPPQVAAPQLAAAQAAVSPLPSTPLASAVELAPTSVDRPRRASAIRARRSTVRPAAAKRDIQVHAQSRWSRLLVGDGRVTPFPVPRVPGSADERVKPE